MLDTRGALPLLSRDAQICFHSTVDQVKSQEPGQGPGAWVPSSQLRLNWGKLLASSPLAASLKPSGTVARAERRPAAVPWHAATGPVSHFDFDAFPWQCPAPVSLIPVHGHDTQGRNEWRRKFAWCSGKAGSSTVCAGPARSLALPLSATLQQLRALSQTGSSTCTLPLALEMKTDVPCSYFS